MSATAKARRARLILVTGLSGSGKSSVARGFEDLGYFCVDNLPLPLLRELLTRPLELIDGRDRIAVIADVRAPGFPGQPPDLLAHVDRERVEPTLVFLEASDEALLRRYSETRRSHPLAADLPVIEGIRRERELLADLRGAADLVLDTTDWTIHQVRDWIRREFAEQERPSGAMSISVVSFGFKFGLPQGTDLLFDVRYLPNPHFVPELRERTGLEGPVRAFLSDQKEYGELVDRLAELLLYLLPRYRRENRSYLTIGVGCTGGKHRSVAVAEDLAAKLQASGWVLRVLHRDIAK